MRKALYILAGLDDRDIIWLAAEGRSRRIEAGETVIEAGVAVAELFFVLDGTLEVVVEGRRIATLGTGDVIGEMSFVERQTPSASVRSLTPSQLLAIPGHRILQKIEADHGFGMRFYRALAIFLSDRLRATSGGATTEIDLIVLEQVQQAGERFLRLVQMAQT